MPLRPAAIAFLATGLMLAGCHKASDEEPQPENQTVEAPPPEALPPGPTQPVAEPPKVEAEKPNPAPEPSADQQVQDDADATGMTSHVSRDGEGSDSGGNSTQQ